MQANISSMPRRSETCPSTSTTPRFASTQTSYFGESRVAPSGAGQLRRRGGRRLLRAAAHSASTSAAQQQMAQNAPRRRTASQNFHRPISMNRLRFSLAGGSRTDQPNRPLLAPSAATLVRYSPRTRPSTTRNRMPWPSPSRTSPPAVPSIARRCGIARPPASCSRPGSPATTSAAGPSGRSTSRGASGPSRSTSSTASGRRSSGVGPRPGDATRSPAPRARSPARTPSTPPAARRTSICRRRSRPSPRPTHCPSWPSELSAGAWWSLAETLHRLAADAQQLRVDATHDPESILRQQLLAGELPLALGYLFPELQPMRSLRHRPGRRSPKA